MTEEMKGTTEEAMLKAEDFYGQMASGEGFEGMDANNFAIPLLLIAQPTSDLITSGDAEALGIKQGEFYNSVSKKRYGSKLKVVVAYFKVMWFEWGPNMGGLKGRHEPGTVPVRGDQFTGMVRTDNGNDIVETWMYFCVLPDFLEDGLVIYQSTRGNIQYLKPWNSAMHDRKEPLYASVWEIELRRNKNDKGTWFAFGEDRRMSVTRLDYFDPQLFLEHVKPVRQIAPTAINRIDIGPQEQALIEGPANDDIKY